jgi:DNA-directed RNA polymerase subunit RPC12/RpoP
MEANSNNGKDLEYKFNTSGMLPEEIPLAERSFHDYIQHYHIDKFSDFLLLEELVKREVLQQRYYNKLGIIAGNRDETKNEIPKHMLNSLNENLEHILILKEKLGLFEEKKGIDDAFQYVQILKKKFQKWMEENQGSRTLVCPHCSQMILLKIKTTSWDASKHPFFRDRLLCNEHLWKLYKEGKITKIDVANILGTATDYVDWLDEKFHFQNPS